MTYVSSSSDFRGIDSTTTESGRYYAQQYNAELMSSRSEYGFGLWDISISESVGGATSDVQMKYSKQVHNLAAATICSAAMGTFLTLFGLVLEKKPVNIVAALFIAFTFVLATQWLVKASAEKQNEPG